jgi:hypothetical protein
MEMRLKQANPANLDAFFTNLRQIWLECRGKITEQACPTSQALTTQSQKDDFKIRLARDLQYTGIATDDATLEQFIYDDLQKKLGCRTAHVRKSPFEPRSVNATKKAVRKVVQKPPVKRIVRLCSVCRKAGHTKINCPGVKTTKKVNYVYQNAEKNQVLWEPTEDSEEPEIEYVLDEEESRLADLEPEIEYVLEEEVEVEEDVKYVDDDESTLNTSD